MPSAYATPLFVATIHDSDTTDTIDSSDERSLIVRPVRPTLAGTLNTGTRASITVYYRDNKEQMEGKSGVLFVDVFLNG